MGGKRLRLPVGYGKKRVRECGGQSAATTGGRMNMKKSIWILLAALLAMLLLTGCGTTDPIQGTFHAASCTEGEEGYKCLGEYLTLEEDGSGVLCYNGEEYTLRYTYSAATGDFSFRDENRVRFEGRFDGSSITGTYGEVYEYLYVTIGAGEDADIPNTYRAISCRMDGESVTCSGDELVLAPDGTGTATCDGETKDMIWCFDEGSFCVYGDGFVMEDGELTDGEIRGTVFGAEYVFSCNAPTIELGVYAATECSEPEDEDDQFFLDGEYLQLDGDGTGVFNFIGQDYKIDWTLDGDRFSFVDEDGDVFDGTYSDGVIEGVYGGWYRYVFEFGAEPTVTDRVAVGQYGATICTDPEDYSVEYYLDGEYLYINSDGTGVFGYLDKEYDFEYGCEGDAFAFQVDDEHMFAGTFEGDEIDGLLMWGEELYRYVFEYDAQPVVENYDSDLDLSDFDISEYTADLPAGTYSATLCVSASDNSTDYFTEGEYLRLESDGTGVFHFVDTDYSMCWGCKDGTFYFIEDDGSEFIGTYTDDGVIEGVYIDAFRYVFEYGLPD